MKTTVWKVVNRMKGQLWSFNTNKSHLLELIKVGLARHYSTKRATRPLRGCGLLFAFDTRFGAKNYAYKHGGMAGDSGLGNFEVWEAEAELVEGNGFHGEVRCSSIKLVREV